MQAYMKYFIRVHMQQLISGQPSALAVSATAARLITRGSYQPQHMRMLLAISSCAATYLARHDCCTGLLYCSLVQYSAFALAVCCCKASR
jgi:hypothetical protein